MSKTRSPGIASLIVGGLLIFAGAYTYSAASKKDSAIGDRVGTTRALLDSTRAQLRETSLRYQGFEKSSPAIPDSVRKHHAGDRYRMSQNYQKSLYVLEMKERDLGLQLTKLRKQEAAAKRRRQAVSVPLAGAGAVTALVGVVLLARSRPRRDAP